MSRMKWLFDWLRSNGRCRSIVTEGVLDMDRYFLLWKDNPQDGNIFPFNIYLHHFKVMDREAFHDHPWWWASLVLRGEYTEYYLDGSSRVRKPGDLIVRDPQSFHAPIMPEGCECWTLFVVGPRVRKWGFLENGFWTKAL